MTREPIKMCGICKRGENRDHADFAVRGRFNGMPYRANLCMAHIDMMRDDGADIEEVSLLATDNISALEHWAEIKWENYQQHKSQHGINSREAVRTHAAYIRIADILQAKGLNY